MKSYDCKRGEYHETSSDPELWKKLTGLPWPGRLGIGFSFCPETVLEDLKPEPEEDRAHRLAMNNYNLNPIV